MQGAPGSQGFPGPQGPPGQVGDPGVGGERGDPVRNLYTCNLLDKLYLLRT